MSDNIATRFEADHLKRHRATPKQIPTLEPGGTTEYVVNHELERWRERRITFLESRLGKAQGILQRDAKKSQIRSR